METYEYNEYDGYFLWLCAKVGDYFEQYSELLYILYDTDFVWCKEILLDQCRYEDGMELREDYAYETVGEKWVLDLGRGCSVLEALIGIAMRMEDNLTDDISGNRTRVWFWQFIENLGLKKFTNLRLTYDGYGREEDDYYIHEVLNRWMHREFEWNGEGSIFPLKNCVRDQRLSPIVYQMADYIFENFVV